MFRSTVWLAVCVLALSRPAAAQVPGDSDRPVILAQGEALLQRPADVAWVQIAVESRGDRSEHARQRAADAMTMVLSALKPRVPAEAIKTSAYSVVPEMEYFPSGGSRVKGYVARNRIEVRVDDLEKLSGVMDAGVTAGASTVSGLRFDLKARGEVEREALRLAVQDAMARARAIALGAGKTIGAIVRIQEQRVSSPRVATQSGERSFTVAGRGGMAPVPIEPGEIDVRAVTLLTVAIN